MARNSSGTWSSPTGQPVVSGTTISSSVHNTLVNDLGTEITDSLSRSGKGGMTAPLKLPDGAFSAPALAFTNDTDTGLLLEVAGQPTLVVGGAAAQQWSPSGTSVVGNASITGTLEVTGETTVNGVSGLTRTDLPAVGEQASVSCAAFTTTAPADVTNLSVTLTTTGRPVLVSVQSDASAHGAGIYAASAGSTYAFVLRGATTIAQMIVPPSPALLGGISLIDTPPAGTYTYKLNVFTSSVQINVLWMKLVALEL